MNEAERQPLHRATEPRIIVDGVGKRRLYAREHPVRILMEKREHREALFGGRPAKWQPSARRRSVGSTCVRLGRCNARKRPRRPIVCFLQSFQRPRSVGQSRRGRAAAGRRRSSIRRVDLVVVAVKVRLRFASAHGPRHLRLAASRRVDERKTGDAGEPRTTLSLLSDQNVYTGILVYPLVHVSSPHRQAAGTRQKPEASTAKQCY